MLFSFKLHYDDAMVYAGLGVDEMKHLIRMKHGSISLRRERERLKVQIRVINSVAATF